MGADGDALPKTRSEEKRWSSEVRWRLPEWIARTVQPVIASALAAEELAAEIRVEGEKLFIDYEATTAGSGYVAPVVMLEFGARSTGEPARLRDVACDAADLIAGVEFPTARPRVMHAERTFWEKATAIHVFCLQERLRGDRVARHWHDVVRLWPAKASARWSAAYGHSQQELLASLRPPVRTSLKGLNGEFREPPFRLFATQLDTARHHTSSTRADQFSALSAPPMSILKAAAARQRAATAAIHSAWMPRRG